MGGTRTLAVIAAILSGVLAVTPVVAQGSAREAGEAADRLRDAFVTAFNEADGEKGASLFLEEGVAMPPYAPAARGRQAIRQYVEGIQTGQQVKMQTLSEGMESVGDGIFDRGILFIEVSTEEGEPAGSDTGKYTLSARRTEEGEWRLEWMIWNYDHPPTVDVQGGGGG